jgi:itaconate CoA-transferase
MFSPFILMRPTPPRLREQPGRNCPERQCGVREFHDRDGFGGACNSEYVAGHQFTSTGRQLDFVRGAYASKGGLSFIAFQSSIKDGKISKIVPRLSGPVTTPRTDVHYVVTENGVANLKGLSSTQRAHALIGLADPTFQNELTAAAKESHLI